MIEREDRPVGGPFRIVVVSATDVSRGPAVRHVLRNHLQALGAGDSVALTSAGTAAVAGEPMNELTARALVELAADPRGHVAHQLTERRLVQADLVLGVSRAQCRRAAGFRPGVRSRSFTVVEFARLVANLPEPIRDPAVLVAAVAGLRTSVRPVDPGEDDLEDLAGGDFRDHERLVRRIDHAVADIARALSAGLPSPTARWS